MYEKNYFVSVYFFYLYFIYDWTKKGNKPDTVCYVYNIFIGSSCIGYFVTHGNSMRNIFFTVNDNTCTWKHTVKYF